MAQKLQLVHITQGPRLIRCRGTGADQSRHIERKVGIAIAPRKERRDVIDISFRVHVALRKVAAVLLQ